MAGAVTPGQAREAAARYGRELVAANAATAYSVWACDHRRGSHRSITCILSAPAVPPEPGDRGIYFTRCTSRVTTRERAGRVIVFVSAETCDVAG